jgi:hypothetical protein
LQTFVGQVNERASRSPEVNNPILAMGASLPISLADFSSWQVQHLKVVIGRFLSRAIYCGGGFPVFKWFWLLEATEHAKGTRVSKAKFISRFERLLLNAGVPRPAAWAFTWWTLSPGIKRVSFRRRFKIGLLLKVNIRIF